MNQNNTVIREALEFEDIIDIISGTADNVLLKLNSGSHYGNISRATSDLILTFPVIVEESVPLKSARRITKAIERNAVSMLQILFSAIMVTNNKDAFDFVKKVHTNLTSDDIEEIMLRLETLPGASDESTEYEISPDALNKLLEANRIIEDDPGYSKEFKDALNEQFEIYTEHNLALQEVTKGGKGGKGSKGGKGGKGNPSNPGAGNRPPKDKDKDIDKKKTTKPKKKFKIHTNPYAGLSVPSVVNSEIKKANELEPTLMIVNFRGPDPENPDVYSAIIGVKAKLHYVSTADMVDRIESKNKDRHGLVELIRATTREIAFWKDFVFAVDKAKLDAISKKKTSSPIWKILERRALRCKAGRIFGATDAAAISTIVISADTADELKKDYDIDVYKPSDILAIMNAYNIMAFFIDDSVNEKVTYLYDNGERTYERLSYADLKKEDKDADLKKVITLLAGSR